MNEPVLSVSPDFRQCPPPPTHSSSALLLGSRSGLVCTSLPPPSVWVDVRCCSVLTVVLLLEIVGIPVVQQLQTSRAAIFTPAAFFRPMNSGEGWGGGSSGSDEQW